MRIRNIALSGAAATALGVAAMVGTGAAFAADSAPTVTTDQTSNVQPAASEAAGVESDGPGGHEDPAGDVDHQFDGEE